MKTDKNILNDTHISPVLIYALAFCLPLVSMLIMYKLFGVFPFGDKTILVMDLDAQYVDFFSYYHRVLTGSESLMYSFTKEMGSTVFGLFAYYLSSPFSLLVLFFSEAVLPEAIALMTMLKIGCCGLTFAIFLRRVFKKSDLSVVLFSCAYALMTYSMHYSMCVMWLDSVIWLPIILLGVERILNNKSVWLFIIAYSVSIFSNYYTSYMSTIFAAIYFFGRYFASDNKKSVKDLLIKTVKLLGSGIICALLAMVILYPAFLDIQNGRVTADQPVAAGFWNIYVANIPRRLFLGQYDTIKNDATPDVFCGMLCGIMTGVFFFSPRIKLKAKICALGVFIIYLVSFFVKRLDIAWHIFQRPTWFPYRYTYTFCFFSIVIAYSGFIALERQKRKFTIAGVGAYALILGAVWIFRQDLLTDRALAILGVIFAAVYIIGVLLMRCEDQKIKMVICAGMILLMCGELVINGYNTMLAMDEELGYTLKNDYSQNVKDISNIADFLDKYDSGLYRAEKTFSRSDNDAMMGGYNGMTHYSSTYNNNVLIFNKSMGMMQEHFASRYAGSTILTDSLLGVKYVASGQNVNEHYEKIGDIDGYSIYKNPYALPLGFAADITAINTPYYDSSSAENQKRLAQSLLGESFVSPVRFITFSEMNNELEFTAEETGIYYWDLSQKYGGDIELTVNDIPIDYPYDRNEKKIYCLGEFMGGDKVHVKIDSSFLLDDPQVFCIDANRLGAACLDKNNGHALDITDYGNTWIEGMISLGNQEILFTTIPYEKGWNVYVDGKKAEVLSAQNAFLAVDAGPGEHVIRLEYSLPGFRISLIISIITLVGMLILAFMKGVNAHKHEKN